MFRKVIPMNEVHQSRFSFNWSGPASRLKMTLLVCIMSFVFLISAKPANWYVRTNSVGSNNGTDWNDAWSTINWSSVSAGDTVWMAGGVYFSSMTFSKAGSLGSPINVKRVLSTDSVPTAAAGWSSAFDSQVIINGSTGNPLYFTASYVSVDGRISHGIVVNIPNVASSNGALLSNRSYINLFNIDFEGPGVGATVPSGGSSPTDWGAGSASDCIASNCIFSGCVNNITADSCTDLIFDHCTLTNSGCANAETYHPDMVQLTGTSYVVMRYCDVSSWPVVGIWLDDNASNLYIYGCVFHNPTGTSGAPDILWPSDNTGGTYAGPIFFYNNTCVNCIVVGGRSTTVQPTSTSIARNNIYWNVTITSGNWIANDDYDFCNATEWSSANTIQKGTYPYANTNVNWQIVSNTGSSYPRNNGTVISAVTPDSFIGTINFNLDGNGNTRGADGAWDIGAYEYTLPTSQGPVISGVDSSPVSTNAVMVSWTTDQAATSIVNYGSTVAYGTSITNSSFVTSHNVTISNLLVNVSYHFQIVCVNSANSQTVSSDYALPPSPPPIPSISSH